jgi:hypothetical protein
MLKWRQRERLSKQMIDLAKILTPQELDIYHIHVLRQFLKDQVSGVRHAAGKASANLLIAQ